MKTFTNGLSIILPTAIILYVLLWILEKTESTFKNIIMFFLPVEYYFFGLGIISGFILVYFVGLLLQIWIFKKLKIYIETLINKMPILNTVYGGVQDFFNFTSNMKESKENIVVMVEIPAIDGKMLGFITVQEFESFESKELEDYILVYLQMSYQVGGYSLFIPKKNISPLDMEFEEAMRFILTAGISANKENKNG
jgi:uncharacterized membrane protein